MNKQLLLFLFIISISGCIVVDELSSFKSIEFENKTIENIVWYATFSNTINLTKLLELPNSEYVEKYGIIRLTLPLQECNGLFFSTGKAVFEGVDSFENMDLCMEEASTTLESINPFYNYSIKNYEIYNLIYSGNFNQVVGIFSIRNNLKNTTIIDMHFVAYNQTEDITYLIFPLGNFILEGVKSEQEAEQSLSKLITDLKNIK